MQAGSNFFKSFVPVKIYQSVSSLYMTCISKMPRNSTQPECDPRLVIEQALVSAVDQTLRPLDYEKRQREAREILLKSQENLFQEMGLGQSSTQEGGMLTEDDEDGALRGPVRLKSEILLNEYRKLYETPSRTASYDSLLLKDFSKYAKDDASAEVKAKRTRSLDH
ncbi:uncharacterized protein LOC108029432 isoform X2 [Drosophila biarmipes]|uniref:uncharacterized protein LOC108029432 isoform X2 n=1 Tax=Drosophila biarmipes TaxID=125945 RepID=UPI0021CD108D|nr:uncharacterized protein LOC108029432 isoform X2 [Drosophila biarmipes]